MEKFLIPTFSKVKKSTPKDNSQVFVIEKLEKGFGNTLGVSLRRTILSSVPGISPFALEIKNVTHEFQSINNVYQDVAEIILNLKDIVIKADTAIIGSDDVFELNIKECSGKILAESFEMPLGLEVVNKDLFIAETSKEKKISIKIYARYSRGFFTFDENRKIIEELLGTKTGLIPMDSNFSPIKKVHYKIEEVNPGESKVYERLKFVIETKGNIEAEDALSFAGSVLSNYFKVFENMNDNTYEDIFIEDLVEVEEDASLQLPIDALNLSVRSVNALTVAGINTMSDLINRPVSALQEIKNLGEKSKMEIIQTVQDMGISFKAE